MAEYNIAVIGGDKRTAYMIPFFMERGYRVIGYKIYHRNDMGIEADGYADSLKQAVESAEVIVGGIPIETYRRHSIRNAVKEGLPVMIL